MQKHGQASSNQIFPAAAIFAVKLDSLHICEQLSKLGTLWCGQCTFGGHNVSGFTLGVIDTERTSEPTLTVSTMDGEIYRCSNGHVEGGSQQQQLVLQPLLNFRTCVRWKDWTSQLNVSPHLVPHRVFHFGYVPGSEAEKFFARGLGSQMRPRWFSMAVVGASSLS